MKILSQCGKYMINLEAFCGLSTAIKYSDNPDKLYVTAISLDRNTVKIGEYSSEDKVKAVLTQIFEHTGERFIMPQDDEVEV